MDHPGKSPPLLSHPFQRNNATLESFEMATLLLSSGLDVPSPDVSIATDAFRKRPAKSPLQIGCRLKEWAIREEDVTFTSAPTITALASQAT